MEFMSLIYNVLYGCNRDSFDTVGRIRQTPSDKSAGRNFSDSV